MSNERTELSRGFTGRHMLLVLITFFGIVIAVNLTMAVFASTSWSGLVADDTYVASQEFNARAAAMRAMAASGIAGKLSIDGDTVHYAITNRDGSAASVDQVTLTFKRPVGDREDFQLALSKTGEGEFEATHHVQTGDWIIEIVSRRNQTVVMHEAVRIDTAESGR